MSSTTPTTTTTKLQAIYTAPHQQSQTFTQPIAAPLPATSPSASTDPAHIQTKITYLAELRKQVPALQNEINIFLTEKMEEDKRAADGQLSEKEAKEEANYGEEVVDEEEDA
ncbi:uncharacterized protein BO72DRAFT_460727 [Aspergillus fijiensis CBS 313.89]|uniref:EKC/KEOPS complex subunit GON7 n=1 Tax=Aspergillus fijiensis CBS 313.89 TaxID=1448319 RepID=A0A8G1RNF9_9EURO|nr:uncharacterized protein BO72DRAFT_460727 [Aspergillus fijiensis CBS 313.89]RAK74995.1 hypothetical protein BO72DRAFT_460727 [Aspergillus fijiensis CBS 313.89]